MVSAIILAGLLGLTAAAPAANGGQQPFKFPLPNGFPNPSKSALAAIEKQAQGTLPDGPLPTKLAAGDVASFQLIAFNEIFEVAFFTSLINNITSNGAGFGAPAVPASSQVTANELVDILRTVQAQEELHYLGANAVLTTSGNKAIKPCEYVFPSSTLTQAVRFASTFTDVVLGALGAVAYGLGENGDSAALPLLSSIVAQEGEQDGYYRSLLGLVPSAQPFLTGGGAAFAYSVLRQTVIVPGSCPAGSDLDIPVFEPLALTTSTPLAAKDQNLSFKFTNTNNTATNNLSLVYINAQNLPIVEPLKNLKKSGKTVTFSATFPYTENLLNGLTYAAVTQGNGPFNSIDDVAASTLYGPALIELN